jgi:hypothetical protein
MGRESVARSMTLEEKDADSLFLDETAATAAERRGDTKRGPALFCEEAPDPRSSNNRSVRLNHAPEITVSAE